MTPFNALALILLLVSVGNVFWAIQLYRIQARILRANAPEGGETVGQKDQPSIVIPQGIEAVIAPESPSLTFGELVRQARKKKGMTQKALAAQLGFSNVYICQVEAGKRPFSFKAGAMARLAALLDVEEGKLFRAAGITYLDHTYPEWRAKP